MTIAIEITRGDAAAIMGAMAVAIFFAAQLVALNAGGRERRRTVWRQEICLTQKTRGNANERR